MDSICKATVMSPGGGLLGPWFTIMDEAILGGEHFVSNVLLNDEAVDFP